MHDAIYIMKISAFLRVILYLVLFVLIVFFIVSASIIFYNQVVVPSLSSFIDIKPISISFSSIYGTMFSGRTNPLYAMGFIMGTAISAFMRPKLEKFIEKVKTKKTVIYVFGSNEIARRFVKSMCEFGFGPMIALVAEKEKPWMSKYKSQIDFLSLDDPDVLKDSTIYEKMEFKNAVKILILVDDKELAQHILLNIRKNNPTVSIILLSRNKPPLLDLSGVDISNIQVIDDIDITHRELIRQISIGFMYANAVETMVPEDYIGKNPGNIEVDFNHRIKVLGVKRGHTILFPDELREGDILILYLVDVRALKEFLQLLPISAFEEVQTFEEIEEEKSEHREEVEHKEEFQEEEEKKDEESRDKRTKDVWGI